jgi:2TM domain-containing protein
MSSTSSTTPAPEADVAGLRAAQKRRFAVDLAIFVSVNAVIAIAWAVLIAFDVHATGLWVWSIVAAVWGVRIVLEGRAAYGRRERQRRSYSEERIQRELKRMS